ncbi:MAG: DivIVA domain-containing protein [Bdellovibrionales bacterium]|nr:DivIVA domain-containing protein [Bdellovibrionales bacterium]
MRIAPIDIAHKTFHRKMMGFDPDEVMDFLRLVAEELESLIKERNSLKETLREKELSIAEYRERDELLKSTITTATRMSEKMQVDAEREAKLIINDANQKAEMIVRESRDSLKRIYGDISELKKVRMQFENNLRALVQSHLTMLEQAQKIMPNPVIEPKISSDIRENDDAQALKAKIAEAIQKNL